MWKGNAMRYTAWLNVLAGLHLGIAVCLVLMCIGTGDQDVALLYLSFSFTTAMIAYGLWFRRRWVRAAVVLVYGILVLGLPILILLIMLLAKGDAAGFAPIIAFYIACFWAGVTPLAALMLWSLCGRRARQVLGEINTVRFGLRDVCVLLLLCGLILGGIAQGFLYPIGVVMLLLALGLAGIAWFLR
jgi:hypothetical protein